MKKTILSLTMIISVIMLTFNCTRSVVKMNHTKGGYRSFVPARSETIHSFFVVLGPEQVSNAAETCGGSDKVVKIINYSSFINVLLATITSELYFPRTLETYCN